MFAVDVTVVKFAIRAVVGVAVAMIAVVRVRVFLNRAPVMIGDRVVGVFVFYLGHVIEILLLELLLAIEARLLHGLRGGGLK